MARSSVRTISVGRSFVRSGAQRSSKCRRRGVFLWTVPSNCRYVRKASRMARSSSSALSVPGQARARASFFSHGFSAGGRSPSTPFQRADWSV